VHFGRRSDFRWLVEDPIIHAPFLGTFLNRLGAVRASQPNAERLLAIGSALAVFPEGMKGTGKLFRDRYRLQRFGRGGFIKLALRTRTPIVPLAIVGSEEAQPILARLDRPARALGLPYFPLTATFPWLGPLGLLPAPTKWSIRFGKPFDFADSEEGAENDEIGVTRRSEDVRRAIRSMLDDMLRTRKFIFRR